MQVLNLAAKLYIVNTKQTKHLLNYVLNLAKYDLNYDLRDRARLIRGLLLTKDNRLHKKAKKFFLSEKPAPNLKSTFSGEERGGRTCFIQLQHRTPPSPTQTATASRLAPCRTC